MGNLLGWDRPDPQRPTLLDRLPPDLAAAGGPAFRGLPFESVYLLENEWAAELANRTMHGILHVGWVRDSGDGYTGRMAILVKPNGMLGLAYMAAIRPFRHLIIYPQWIRQIGSAWRAMHPGKAPGCPRSAIRGYPAGLNLRTARCGDQTERRRARHHDCSQDR